MTAELRPAVIYRPESAMFWLYVIALLAGILGLLVGDGGAIHETMAAHLALAPVWLAFIVFLVWLMYKFDPYRSVRRYPQALVAGSALGGTTAMVMSANGNTALGEVLARYIDPGTLSAWQAALTAPVIEEAAKALCASVILMLCFRVFNRIPQALLVGMFVGFGFDIVEDLTYATNEALNSLDSDLLGAGGNLMVRILTAIPAHWAYTGLVTVGVLVLLPTFADRSSWSWRRRVGVAVPLLAAGPFMHFIWNAPVPDILSKFAINITVFGVAVALLMRYQRRRLVALIAAARTDGRLSGVDPGLLDSLPSARGRRQLRREAGRSGGRAARKAAKYRQRAALDLLQVV
ncbi:PrsW family glutamic-type intramembrane protease [Mycobacterium sp. CVI_P3]|uniref:PrsW family glutamic-type intramembrane protease n=1 Tax=Mycobacterium pinniadriaticum TaxID=2994102 RepID=A0ABT3SB96_9MYCO|nr:PrsW family glutamic-type intramembrane protease [Mycobacterium pinniadriaticum]MCX2930156.1 PrsW family glutamic-type intramembrane protease [Mycobacterium pinniadriaticum]MCX2936782.1 PrsW family glutamic-type intramembrane protease [Mycobacterium pinniadriaticum]